MPEIKDSTTAIDSNTSVDDQEETRGIHRARTLEQLTSGSSTSREKTNEHDEARRLHRRIAGRCGGEFKLVEENGQRKYRHVWPDSQSVLIDRLIAWAHPIPEDSLEVHKQSNIAQNPGIRKPVDGCDIEGETKDAGDKERMLTQP